MWASLAWSARPTALRALVLIAVVVVATLNRERALVIVSFVAALAWLTRGVRWSAVAVVAPAALAFAATYVGLRVVLGWTDGVAEQAVWRQNLTTRNGWVGLAFWVTSSAIVLGAARTGCNRRAVATFAACSLPYILMSFYAGVAWELRLWVPVLLGGLCLAGLDPQAIRPRTVLDDTSLASAVDRP